MHCQCDGGIAKCLKASKSSQRVDIPNSKPKAWKFGFQQNGIAINFSRCRSWKTVVTITLHELQYSIEPRRKPSYFALYCVNRILIWFMKIPIKLGNLIPYTTQPAKIFFLWLNWFHLAAWWSPPGSLQFLYSQITTYLYFHYWEAWSDLFHSDTGKLFLENTSCCKVQQIG